MPCSSCGQRREVVSPEQAAAMVGQGRPRATYTVTEPDGNVETFYDYQLAASHRRRTNGTLTTTTEQVR